MTSKGPRHLRAVLDAPRADEGDVPVARRVLRKTLARERVQRGSLLGWLMLMGLAAIAAAIVGPHLVDVELAAEPGFKGTVARARVVADRDYDVVLDEETAERRRAARAMVPVRYDHDPRAGAAARAALVESLVDFARDPEDAVARTAVRAAIFRARSLDEEPRAEAQAEDARLTALHPTLAAFFADESKARALREAIDEVSTKLIVDDRASLVRAGAREILVVLVGEPRARPSVADVEAVVAKDTARAAFVERLAPIHASLPDEIVRAFVERIEANLTQNASSTEIARARAERETPPVVRRVRRGETVLVPGQLIDDDHLTILRAMSDQQGDEKRARTMLATFAFVLLVSFVVYRFGFGRQLASRARIRDLSFLSLIVLMLLLALVGVDALLLPLHERSPDIPRTALVFAIPTTWAAMQARMVKDADGAFAVALLTSIFAGAVSEPALGLTVVTLLASLVGIAGVGQLTSRWTVIFAGLTAGTVGALAAVSWELFRGALEGQALVWLAGALVVNGLLSGVLVLALSPLLEGVFGYVSDLRLLSLDDMNSPLLKELVVRAPGTWHHAIRVAALAERAAAAVGANARLARAIGLFHDVGKLAAPESFIENTRADREPHAPDAQAARVRAHVEEGRALAVQHRLPRAVIAGIEEHHGDRDAVDRRSPTTGDASARTGGRRPRSKESALVLLADRVEWATRALEERAVDDDDGERAAAEIARVVTEAALEGSLIDGDLTLGDLELVKESFAETLADLSPRHAERGEGARAQSPQNPTSAP